MLPHQKQVFFLCELALLSHDLIDFSLNLAQLTLCVRNLLLKTLDASI